MDLRVIILDKNGDERAHLEIYQDGSDTEGACQIVNWINETFTVEDYGHLERTVSNAYAARTQAVIIGADQQGRTPEQLEAYWGKSDEPPQDLLGEMGIKKQAD